MDFEYHGALRDMAIDQTLAPSAPFGGMEQWDALMIDLDDIGLPRESNNESTYQYLVASETNTSIDKKPIPTPQHNHLTPSVPVVTNGVCTEALQRQIDQLRDVVAQLIGQQQSGEVPKTAHAALQSPFDSCRSDSVLGSSEGFARLSDPSQYQLDSLATEETTVYSRRGSASTVSSIPSKRGQRIPGGYLCQYCDVTFDIPSQLRHHERKHISKDERPFPCCFCSDRFLYPKDLSRHQERMHGSTTTSNNVSSSSLSLAESSPTQTTGEDHYYSRNNWQSRISTVRRNEGHWDLPKATAKRKRKQTSHERSHVQADVRNSTIPETEVLNVTTGDHTEALRGLQIQIDLQQETIDRLEMKLAKTEVDAEAWLEERNTFAKVLQRLPGSISRRPNTFFEQRNKRMPGVVERAKGWLGAIDKLLSTNSAIKEEMHRETVHALEHVAAALDEMDLGARN